MGMIEKHMPRITDVLGALPIPPVLFPIASFWVLFFFSLRLFLRILELTLPAPKVVGITLVHGSTSFPPIP